MNNQFEELDSNRLVFQQHLMSKYEETNSRMIIIGEITSIEVLMKLNYDFLNVNNILSYGNKKQFLSRSSSYFNNLSQDDEEEDEDFLLLSEFNNAQSSSSNISVFEIYRSFKLLKDRLKKKNNNINVLMDHCYLKPFCDLIINKDISGRITSVALGSLLKFLNYGLFDHSESQGSAQLVCETMIKVRFISTNTSSDEVVLMRILLLIKELVTRGFDLINNRTMYGMIRTCFRIIFEHNLSELLRRNAEHTLIDIVRHLFKKLDELKESEFLLKLEPNKSAIKSRSEKEEQQNDKKRSLKNSTLDLKQSESDVEKRDRNVDENVKLQPQKCYDLECIYDLFIYLVQIVNPTEYNSNINQNNLLMTNQVGLNILIVIFETAVITIGQKASLMKSVKNELCWNLVNIIQPDRQLTYFSLGLRLSSIVFLHLRTQLKYQFQEILIKVLEILSSKTSPSEYKDLAIDFLHMFFLQIPFLPHEIFVNYDCDPYALNILEDLLNLLSKNCFLNSKLTNIQSAGDSSDVPVFSFVKKKSFDLLLLVLMSLQKAEIENYVLVAYENVPKFKKLFGSVDENISDPNEINKKNVKGFFLPSTHEEIVYLKERKKLLWEASEHFNAKPSKGIQFLQDKKLVENDQDLIKFLRENTRLDKKELGDYLSNRKNEKILVQFVQSFNFVNSRLDDALRLFLESFRLPGEAPLIATLMEQFASHWFETNNRPFVDVDAAFALSYAIIMLNTDQHNSNVRQSMTCDDFVRNVRGVNGGKDFDQEMLKSIYYMIQKNKIITPAEQQGIIREKYLWKCMLTKSDSSYGNYYHAVKSKDDQQQQVSPKCSQIRFLNASIFEIMWGPSISSFTFLFDKINIKMKAGLLKKILNQGFTSCAFLCARYGHLDDLIVSLCKFTINSAGGPMSPLLYSKSQEAALCLFHITKEYANEIRESWKSLIEIILNWFKAKFLDEMFEVIDFALNNKCIKLKRKIKKKANHKNLNENPSNIFTGLFQFFSGNDRNDLEQDGSLYSRTDDKAHKKNQPNYIYEQPLNILRDSKFFHFESLNELIKAIIAADVEFVDELGDDVKVFKLELLFQVLFLNRDRVAVLWPQISSYLVKLLKSCETSEFLSERTISAIFRLAIRFICRPEKLNNQIFELVKTAMRTLSGRRFQHHYTALAIYTFITHSHCYLSTADEWKLINEVILYVGINYKTDSFIPSNLEIGLSSTEDIHICSDQELLNLEFEKLGTVVLQRGYTSDSELDLSRTNELNKQFSNSQDTATVQKQSLSNPYQLMTGKIIGLGKDSYRIRDIRAYERCLEIQNLIVKDIIPKYVQMNFDQTITDQNLTGILESCIDTLRKFVEASIKIQNSLSFSGCNSTGKHVNPYKDNNRRKYESINRSSNQLNLTRQHSLTLLTDSEVELDDEDTADPSDYNRKLKERRLFQAKIAASTENCCIKLLELMHFLHVNVNFINQNTQDENDQQKQQCINNDKKTLTFDYLWTYIWCPLLQGIALLCCDIRKKVRLNAYTYLERQLLNPELKSLTAEQWENCFNKVLFPLLAKLLEQVNQTDLNDMDETRERVTSLLSKVYLQHLSSLYTLPTFTALWLTILEFMEKYMKAEMKTELVKEAIPQRLKNMLQVMINANCLNDDLSTITWDRIHLFLPNFKNEILSEYQLPMSPVLAPQQIVPTIEHIVQDHQQPNVLENQQFPSHEQHHTQQPYCQPSDQQYNLPDLSQQTNVDDKTLVKFNENDILNQYCMVDYNNLHGLNNPPVSQKNSEGNLYVPYANTSNQSTSLNKEDTACGQLTNYDEQVMRQQPKLANYTTTHYQTESVSQQQQLPTQSVSQHPNHHQAYSMPTYQENSSMFGSSIYQLQISNLRSINTQMQIQSPAQQPNSLPVYESGLNYVPKTIEMSAQQGSMSSSEVMYQQKKNHATSTVSYNVGPCQSKSRYPWPMPKNS